MDARGGEPIPGGRPSAADACILAAGRGLPLVVLDPENLAASMLAELAARLTSNQPLRRAG